MTSNRLPTLADEIRKTYTKMQDATRTAAEKALEAGHALIEAKALVRHGGWLPFLAQAGVQERTARRLMRLASSGLEADTVSDLGGATSTLRLLSLRERAVAKLRDAAAPGADINAIVALLEETIAISDEMLAMFASHDEGGAL